MHGAESAYLEVGALLVCALGTFVECFAFVRALFLRDPSNGLKTARAESLRSRAFG